MTVANDDTDAPVTSPRHKTRQRLALITVLLIVAAPLHDYAFCNWSWHSQAWTRSRLDGAIERGLDYLDHTGTFGKRVDNGGESPPHHFFLGLVLRRHPHAALEAQMARARDVNRDNWQWRTFYGMPGWPRHELTALDRQRIKYAVSHSDGNYYAEWLLHGLYPAWTKLRPEEHERLLDDPSKLQHGYHLTHALIAYIWMKQTDPAIADAHDVDRLIQYASDRLIRAHTWDPRTSDIYNERVAFWFYMGNGPPIRRRWIERILLSQNVDGGWTFEKSTARTLGQAVGYDPRRGKSDPHATFLALYALSEYEAQSSNSDVHK